MDLEERGGTGTCVLHKNCLDKIKDCNDNVNEIFHRLRELELKDVAKSGEIKSLKDDIKDLARSIDGLVDFGKVALWKFLGAVGLVMLTLAGFMLWYIQQLLPMMAQIAVTGIK